MAGYQRHDFEAIPVSPGSDGGWGAFARGFSNGHSMGRAISTAVNRRNISKANEDYQKDVEAANQQDIKTQEEMDPELKKAGVSDRAAIMTKSQLEKLSPEAQEYFKGYYRDQQNQGNKPEYRYDSATRQGMLEDAASRQKEAIQSSFLRHMGPEAYNDYLKSEAEGSKASFEKFIIDGKMGFAKELRDLRNNKAAMVEKAVEMGQLPQGSVFDPKSGQVLTPGQNGQMVPMPISDADINNFMDSYELQGWRKFGAGMDDFLKGQQAEITLATKGDQIEAAGLKNKETKAKIKYLGDVGKAKLIDASKKGTTGGTVKPRKVKLDDPDENGTRLERDAETQQPTGYSTDARGSRWPNEFPTNQAYQEALAVAKKAGVEIIQNKEGAIAYQAGNKRFNSLSQANAFALEYAKGVNNNAQQKRAKAIETEARSPAGRARTMAIQDAALKLAEEEENPYGDYYAE